MKRWFRQAVGAIFLPLAVVFLAAGCGPKKQKASYVVAAANLPTTYVFVAVSGELLDEAHGSKSIAQGTTVKVKGTVNGSESTENIVRLERGTFYNGSDPAIPAADLVKDARKNLTAFQKRYTQGAEGQAVIVEGKILAIDGSPRPGLILEAPLD